MDRRQLSPVLRDIGVRHISEHFMHSRVDHIVEGVPDVVQKLTLAAEPKPGVCLEGLADLREGLALHVNLCCGLWGEVGE